MDRETRLHTRMRRHAHNAVLSVIVGIIAASFREYFISAAFLVLSATSVILAMRAQAHLDHIYDHLDDEHTETYPSFERFMEHEAPNYEG